MVADQAIGPISYAKFLLNESKNFVSSSNIPLKIGIIFANKLIIYGPQFWIYGYTFDEAITGGFNSCNWAK